MGADLPGLWFRIMALIRVPRRGVGVHTRAAGFIPLTGQARHSVGLAWQEARRGGNELETEHILLGLIDGEGTAARALGRLGISSHAVHQQVGQVIGQDQQQPAAPPSATAAARQVLARWALGEALGRGHRYIDTEDLLLALYRESDGAAAQALARLGAGESQVRGAVTALLAESRG
jgi:ATP-dependent Clp protease ATP-binding subunit ClpC